MRKTSLRLLLSISLFLLASFLSNSCGDGSPQPNTDATLQPAEVALKWNELFLELERYAPNYRPCPAARALGYLGLAAYEACITGMPGYNSIAERVLGLSLPRADKDEEYYWPEVVNATYGYLMPLFFEHLPIAQKEKIKALETFFEQKLFEETAERTFIRSRAHGQDLAYAIWQWAQSDAAGHQAHKDPFRGYNWQARNTKPYDWEPLSPGPDNGLFPYWGNARTFALPKNALLCRPPLPYSETTGSALHTQALEVYSQNTPQLPYESRWIAEYWSDDLLNLTFSPASRWIAITNQVIEKESASLAVALEAYAKVGLALNDASVGCWHSKYHYNIERPQSYIRRIINANWQTSLNNPLTGERGLTPSSPSFPSSHAVFAAAAAEALSSVFGYAYSMTDRCHATRTEFIGTPRTFDSFYEMAQECGWSRVLLGVHFRMDIDEGLRFGTSIGRHVAQLPWKQ
ncbi:MAG: phosphatase PAP2 family protein [Saprospiraceae bacterium]|nr:phosphatase PAP2 family protein [Saprospiraceae bacterium]MDW8483427.1 phosphatase PAP2 family protein [Saprospiraceae bacterium]